MKRTIMILKNGDVFGIANLREDDGTPFDTFGLLRSLGLPDPVELIKRDSKQTSAQGSGKTTSVAEYAPDWKALAESFARLRDNLKLALDTRPGLLVARITETSGIFADCPVRDGMDALAAQAAADDDRMFADKTGIFNARIQSVVKGVCQTPDGLYVPCVYALYDGSGEKHLRAIGVLADACAGIAEGDSAAYSIRTIRERE
jgi:hypothetical protein